MSINLNQSPYFDDYSEDKKFYKILFRPGYAVQTRELNQLQTLLQKQIERFGNGVYKEGAMVIPGGLSYSDKLAYVKVTGNVYSVTVVSGTHTESEITNATAKTAAINAFVGKRIIGGTTGVQGTIKAVNLATDTTPLTLFIEYDTNGTNGTTETFTQNEVLTIRSLVSNVSNENFTGWRVDTASTDAVGVGSVVEIAQGVYYARGNFVYVEPQLLIIDAYSATPSHRVGFNITETIITPEVDSTLSDNAAGSYNFSAPGAHRYQIQLTLAKTTLDTTFDTNFIELLKVVDGVLESHVTTTEYSELAKEFARRTYDESGDYAVSQFRMNAKEARNNDRGAWATSANYLIGDVVTANGYTYTATTAGLSGGTIPSHTTGIVTDGTVSWAFDPSPVYNNGHITLGSQNQVTIAIEPGKAYVRGYELQIPSTTFVNIDKARDFAQVKDDLIPTTIGNYALVTSVTGVPDIAVLTSVNLYIGSTTSTTVVGTARIRGIEKDGALYRIYLFNVTMNAGYSFDRNVKLIGNANFSSPVENTVIQNGVGTVGISTSTVTGVGTNFTRDFVAGDYIEVNGVDYQVSVVGSATSITIVGTASVTAGATYKLFRTAIQDPQRLQSFFGLGKSYIKSSKDENGAVDSSYVIMQKATVTTGVGVTTATISISSALDNTGLGSKIDPNTEAQEILLCKAGSAMINPATVTVNGPETGFTVTGLTASSTYTVFFPVTKATASTAAPKTKTIVRNAVVDKTTADAFEPRVISLGKADALKIRQILMTTAPGAITSTSTFVDITSHYDLDNGQRDTHYDVASIVRKPSYGAPTGTIRIIFDYFSHSATGDYFSADSYLGIRYEDIPTYVRNGSNVYLTDVIDYRPRMADDGSGFTGTGGALAMPPKPGASTRFSYSYYLGRIDKISLDVNGKFVVSKGTSAETPYSVDTPDLTMNMAIIKLAPYTASVKDVFIQKIDNRRYTMRDIGSLERRIDNLEYYTSLSLLEQEASSLQLQDEFGLNRFKNGFIVDNFTSHFTSDATSSEFRASIDTSARQLRPSFSMDNINLIEKVLPAQRSGYQVTGDVVTLPYTEKSFISQLFASRPENINPFAIFTFIGQAELNPPSDEWIETRRAPEVINNVEGNFSEVLANAQRQGVLGTEWNAWQTQWAGTSTGATRSETQFRGEFPPRRDVTFAETIETSQQARTGINTTVQATFSKEIVGDRIISTSVVPFIRSRQVVFLARSMRLQTTVYPFFDKVNISQYITPASRLTFSGVGSATAPLFDYETNVGRDNDEKARRFDGNVQTAYNKGDVIFLKQRGTNTYASADVSPCTAICVLQEVQPGGTNRSALLVNPTGNFQVGDIIGGSISGVQATVVSYTATAQGDPLRTNFGGDVAGVFNIPSNDAVRFSTGNREFKLVDNLENNDLIAKTRAHGSYRAEGVLQTWQSTFNSVRNGEIIRTRVSDARTITSVVGEQVVSDTGWYDPLAQTFLVQNKGGAFITSVDIWFASVDPIKPVTMQIREVVNGYPGKVILPFSSLTLHPYQLRDENQPTGFGLSSNTRVFENNTYLAPDKPTRFKMKSPVYVQDLGEYCVVLFSDSNNYNVWTSELGGIDLTTATPRLISEQPYAGVLFKSQNGSTWTACQNEDMMFRINVAQFQSSGAVEFHNQRLGLYELDSNPFFTRGNSKLVRVFHPNHGLIVGSKVTISNVNLALTTAQLNGIPITELNAQHTVLHVDQDTYVIRVTTKATVGKTGRMGGTGVKATYNIKFDAIHPVIQYQSFSDTSIDFGIKSLSSNSINGELTPGVMNSSFSTIIANENNDFFAPQMAASPENETLYNSGNKSVIVRAAMSTTNPYLSPVIDSARTSIIAINNRIDDPRYTASAGASNTNNYNGAIDGTDGAFDIYPIVAASSQIVFSGKTISTASDAIKATFKAQRVGKHLKISGSVTNSGGENNNGDCLILAISADGSSITTDTNFESESGGSITINIYDNFIDEIAPNGSTASKYLTKKISLSDASGSSTNLNIRFNASIPAEAAVDVYYKTGLSSSVVSFDDQLWSLYQTVTANTRATDLSFSIGGLAAFDTAAVKLVMRSSNSASVPRISDLIVIATA